MCSTIPRTLHHAQRARLYYEFDYPLVGKFNVENIMCAFGIGIQLGIGVSTIIDALREAAQIPGRLERVHTPHDGGVSVFVDYAHTPDALEKALGSIMALTPGRTICVFGCGGDRDASKRPIMGRAALGGRPCRGHVRQPRTEEPDAIIADIVAGMGQGEGRFDVQPDRRAAIARAIQLAKPGDSILVAGKGHEDYQLVGKEVLSFDDRVVAREELNVHSAKELVSNQCVSPSTKSRPCHGRPVFHRPCKRSGGDHQHHLGFPQRRTRGALRCAAR